MTFVINIIHLSNVVFRISHMTLYIYQKAKISWDVRTFCRLFVCYIYVRNKANVNRMCRHVWHLVPSHDAYISNPCQLTISIYIRENLQIKIELRNNTPNYNEHFRFENKGVFRIHKLNVLFFHYEFYGGCHVLVYESFIILYKTKPLMHVALVLFKIAVNY